MCSTVIVYITALFAYYSLVSEASIILPEIRYFTGATILTRFYRYNHYKPLSARVADSAAMFFMRINLSALPLQIEFYTQKLTHLVHQVPCGQT